MLICRMVYGEGVEVDDAPTPRMEAVASGRCTSLRALHRWSGGDDGIEGVCEPDTAAQGMS